MINKEFYTIDLKTFSEYPENIVNHASVRVDDLYVDDRESVEAVNDRILESMIRFLDHVHNELFVRKLSNEARCENLESHVNGLDQISQFVFFLFYEKYTASSRKFAMRAKRKLSNITKKIYADYGVLNCNREQLHCIDDILRKIDKKVKR